MKKSFKYIVSAMVLFSILFGGLTAFAEDNRINPLVSSDSLGTSAIGNSDDENVFATRFDVSAEGDPNSPNYRNRQ